MSKLSNLVAKNSGISERLVSAVIRQLGGERAARESMHDIANHGIDGGFGKFVYTADTVAFFKRNRREILALVEQQAADLGESSFSMLCSFNCLSDGKSGADRETQTDILRVLGGGRVSESDHGARDVMNALAWFAGEEVARAYCDMRGL